MPRTLSLNWVVPRPRTRTSSRDGLTLFEVLIAIACLLIGLLGVMALIPIGYRAAMEGIQTDCAAACKNWAWQEFQLRGMRNPDRWAETGKTRFDLEAAPELTPFVIDPLMVAQNPYSSNPGISAVPATGSAPYPIRRLTLQAPDEKSTLPSSATLDPTLLPGAAVQILDLPSAERLFKASDDLSFERPDDVTARPLALFRDAAGETTDVPASGVAAMSKGEYSWLFTVVPNLEEASLPFASKTKFVFSVAVCHKRSTDPTSERYAPIQSGFFASGTGEIQLAPGDFEIAERQWVLVVGNDFTTNTRFFEWYRVIAAVEPDPPRTNNWLITLQGPAWDDHFQPVQVTIVPGVVDVQRVVIPN